jgi:murein DD-endopeptidase MepM/ murein hydrolase activator NlpD
MPILEVTVLPEICQYRVSAGDTLWGIAQEFGASVDQIQRESGLSNPDLIYEGQVLSLPGGYREGCVTELVAGAAPGEGDLTDVADFSRGPLAGASVSGWEHGEDENASSYDLSGCNGWRPEDQPCLHPGYDIYSSDSTVRANAGGVVRYYQTYTHQLPDGSTEIRTVEYDPEDPVANEDLVWFGNYAVLETTLGGETYYQVLAHMDGFSDDLASGDTVEAGTTLGTMDSTGNSTGDHVHWEVRTEEGYVTSETTGNLREFYPDSAEDLDDHFVDPLTFEEWLP